MTRQELETITTVYQRLRTTQSADELQTFAATNKFVQAQEYGLRAGTILQLHEYATERQMSLRYRQQGCPCLARRHAGRAAAVARRFSATFYRIVG
jgi:hypothetical protein